MAVATILLNQASVMQTTSSNTANIPWGKYKTLALDVNCTDKQGTSPTLQILVDRLAADGVTYLNIWASSVTSVSSASTGTPVQFIRSIGPGCATNEEIGDSGRIRWIIGGSATPGAKFNISLIGK